MNHKVSSYFYEPTSCNFRPIKKNNPNRIIKATFLNYFSSTLLVLVKFAGWQKRTVLAVTKVLDLNS